MCGLDQFKSVSDLQNSIKCLLQRKYDLFSNIYIYMPMPRYCQSQLWGNCCYVSLFSRNVIYVCMNSTIPGNTMIPRIFSGSFWLQCKFVFISKFFSVICQNFSGGNKVKNHCLTQLRYLQKLIFSLTRTVYIFLDQHFLWMFFSSNCHSKWFKIAATLKTISPQEYSKTSCQPKKSYSFAESLCILWVMEN